MRVASMRSVLENEKQKIQVAIDHLRCASPDSTVLARQEGLLQGLELAETLLLGSQAPVQSEVASGWLFFNHHRRSASTRHLFSRAQALARLDRRCRIFDGLAFYLAFDKPDGVPRSRVKARWKHSRGPTYLAAPAKLCAFLAVLMFLEVEYGSPTTMYRQCVLRWGDENLRQLKLRLKKKLNDMLGREGGETYVEHGRGMLPYLSRDVPVIGMVEEKALSHCLR